MRNLKCVILPQSQEMSLQRNTPEQWTERRLSTVQFIYPCISFLPRPIFFHSSHNFSNSSYESMPITNSPKSHPGSISSAWLSQTKSVTLIISAIRWNSNKTCTAVCRILDHDLYLIKEKIYSNDAKHPQATYLFDLPTLDQNLFIIIMMRTSANTIRNLGAETPRPRTNTEYGHRK